MYETYSAELCHHGILGQKWGVRRFQNSDGSLTAAGQKRYDVKEAKAKYKQSKKDLKRAIKVEKAGLSTAGKWGAGVKGIKELTAAQNRVQKKEQQVIDNKAALAKAKHGEKGEFKAYRKEMQKSGIRGSAADTQYNNRSTKLYNHIREQKGKEYADRVEKEVQNTAVKQLIGAGVVLVGTAVVEGYLNYKY